MPICYHILSKLVEIIGGPGSTLLYLWAEIPSCDVIRCPAIDIVSWVLPLSWCEATREIQSDQS